ncbi:hypothetical protein [Jidongwangia harbinensis]|uniref:hypothetical protein n=1 Tax=Jidongwangia harbinensis TaxID=2878561 RepID=UPI001CDA06FF|nr:hypothetical protein [Jidongwangia harbinensis]MCA2214434.1 hypothetical protein [Jidongwangia harbinensis]
MQRRTMWATAVAPDRRRVRNLAAGMAVAAVVGVAQVAVSPAPAAADTPLSAVATSRAVPGSDLVRTADEIWHRQSDHRYKWLCEQAGIAGVPYAWTNFSCEKSGDRWVLWVQRGL